MPLPRPRSINCFLCDHYAPNDFLDFQGMCTAKAVTGDGSIGSTTAGNEFPHIPRPADTYCGDFKKWNGVPREQGNCYPIPEVE
jgi:hypothetical protein